MTGKADIVKLVTESIQDRKGRHITHIDLSDIESAAASNFIICEGTSTMQVSAIADNVREHLLEEAGIKPYNYDGYQNSQWIVIDYGDTLVHVFIPEMRERYNLEELWSDAPLTEIPDLD
ncbi:MAG: ribosome silencing factor [Barnesiella sp.]|nr:ribosome silencing factor [Barnesiella sp.]MBD5331280.1 ribosome silencing factor [Bacteroides sp.]MBD5374451.1 ribosome silencing factor [Bacteroides sp.]MDE7460432.1 ribosome silencing factor [Paramuribaculum sp.]